jgi:nitrate/nitrite transporter NarK
MPAMQTGFLKQGRAFPHPARRLPLRRSQFMGRVPSLTVHSKDQHGLSPVAAGYFTAAAVFVGSFVSPLNGAVADRIGGVRSLTAFHSVAAAMLGIAACGDADAPPRASFTAKRGSDAGE